jgi:hypothetical protein
VCGWLVVSGALWSLVGERLAYREDFAVVSALLDQRTGETHEVIAIGDGLFLAHFRQWSPERFRALEIKLPRVHMRYLADMLEIVAALPHQAPIVVQSSPYLWSNMELPGNGQKLGLWKAMRRPMTFRFLPQDDVRLFFDLVGLWASTRNPSPYPDTRRPNDVSRLNFEPQPYFLDSLRNAAAEVEDRLIWVADRTGVSYNAAPALLAGFDDVVHGASDPARPGRFVEWQDLDAVVRELSEKN